MNATMRYRLFLITAALLYLGPLVAGLAGYGWPMIPVFAAIFLLWLLIMRPAMWPVKARDWLTPHFISKFLLSALVQAATVGFCFGVGRGIGGTMGALANVPVWVPPLMSLLAIPLSRIFWNPALISPEMTGYLDQASADILALCAQEAVLARENSTSTAAPSDLCLVWLGKILALPEDTTDHHILALLADALAQVKPLALLNAMAEPAELRQHSATLRRAFVLLATETEVAGKLLGQGQLARAFDMAGEDAARLRLYAERTLMVLKTRRMALMDTPPTQQLRDVATRHPMARAALLTLTAQMDRLNDA